MNRTEEMEFTRRCWHRTALPLLRFVLALVLAGVTVGSLPGAAPPARLTAEQTRRLQQRQRWLIQAGTLAEQGKVDEAIAAVEKGLALERSVYGTLRGGSLAWLDALAQLQEHQGRFGAAITARREALTVRQRLYGAGHWRVTNARLDLEDTQRLGRMTAAQRQQLHQVQQWNDEVVRLWQQGKSTQALPLAKKALASRRLLLGERHRDTASSWFNLGAQHASLHQGEHALRYYEHARAIYKEVLGEKHPLYAASLNNLASLYQDQGQYDRAVPLFEQAVAVCQATMGQKNSFYADCLNNLARVYEDMGEHRKALPLLQRCLKLRRELGGTKNASYAKTLNNLGVLYHEMGEHRQALPLLQQALVIRREVVGTSHPDYGESLGNLALHYHAMGAYRKALPLLELAGKIYRKVHGEKHPSYANHLQSLAAVYQAMGEYRLAQPLLEQAQKIYLAVHSEKHPSCITNLNNLAALHKARGDLRQALLLFEQARKRRLELLGPRHPDYATSLQNLALVHKQREEYDRALPLLQQALRIQKESFGEGNRAFVTGLFALAGVYQAMGEYAKALPLSQRALQLSHDLLGPRHPNHAAHLTALGLLYHAMGESRRALPVFREALELIAEVRGEKHPDYATGLSNLATVYLTLGEHRQALPLAQKAVQRSREVLGDAHPDHAFKLNNLAGLYQAMGEHRLALPLFQQALKAHRETHGERSRLYAHLLNNLALLYKELGEYRLALPLFRQSLRLQQDLVGPRHPDYANTLHNLALLHHNLQEPRLALNLYQQSLHLTETVLGKKHPHYPSGLANLALVYEELGEYDRTWMLSQRAVQLRKEIQGVHHPDYALSLNNLAMLHHRLGAHRQAFRQGQEALQLRKELLGEKHPAFAQSLNTQARLYQALGNQGAALRFAAWSATLTQAYLDDSLGTLSERQRQQILEDRNYHLQWFLSQAVGQIPPASLYGYVAGIKGASNFAMEQQLARQQPALRPLLAELRDVRILLARLGGQAPSGAALLRWREQFDELDRRKTELEQKLARHSADYAPLRQRPTAARVAAALPRRTALIEFLSYQHFLHPDAQGRWSIQRRVLAFILRPDREAVLVELGSARYLDAMIRLWRRTLPESHEADETAADRLRQHLWLPLARHLDGVSTVLIAPDGQLAGLPFAALPGEKAGTFLIENYTFGYLTSGRQLLLPSLASTGEGLLALAGADFGKPSDTIDPLQRPRDWSPLPGAEAEAQLIKDAFTRAFPRAPVQVLSGKQSDRAGLLSSLERSGGDQRWRYLHLATHGHIDRPNMGVPPAVVAIRAVGSAAAPGLGGLTGGLLAALVAQEPGILDAKQGFDPSGRRTRVEEGMPMLLTSLVLAGANDNGAEAYVSAEEIAGMDLTGCQLAVLSACQTGLGTLAGWQGVQGLQKAFHQAGARHVLASLWNVSDPATSVLMEEFYRQLWKEKRPALEALRQAQLFVLRNPQRVYQRDGELTKSLASTRGSTTPMRQRGIGLKAKPAVPGPKGEARSPVVWWAPWVLSGMEGR